MSVNMLLEDRRLDWLMLDEEDRVALAKAEARRYKRWAIQKKATLEFLATGDKRGTGEDKQAKANTAADLIQYLPEAARNNESFMEMFLGSENQSNRSVKKMALAPDTHGRRVFDLLAEHGPMTSVEVREKLPDLRPRQVMAAISAMKLKGWLAVADENETPYRYVIGL